MADPLGDLLNVLLGLYNDPLIFLPIAFLFAVAVAIVLPIPIELALLRALIDQRWGYLSAIALALAAGKTVGAWLIFILGVNLEGKIRAWSARWRFAALVVRKAEAFVRKTKYTGLYILLSIPLMSDTIPLYIYSLFNEEGQALRRDMYLIANFLAALNRTALLVVLFFIGLNLFF
ncbi:MAG: hypothetical protein ACT4OI_05915 [Methanobacteriota archaeon]